MSSHESFNISHRGPEVAPGDESLLEDLDRGADPQALEDLGHVIPDETSPAVDPRFTAGVRELNELHPQHPINEDRFRGSGTEVTQEEAEAMSKEHGSRCGDCGAIGGNCQHWRRKASGKLGAFGE